MERFEILGRDATMRTSVGRFVGGFSLSESRIPRILITTMITSEKPGRGRFLSVDQRSFLGSPIAVISTNADRECMNCGKESVRMHFDRNKRVIDYRSVNVCILDAGVIYRDRRHRRRESRKSRAVRQRAEFRHVSTFDL